MNLLEDEAFLQRHQSSLMGFHQNYLISYPIQWYNLTVYQKPILQSVMNISEDESFRKLSRLMCRIQFQEFRPQCPCCLSVRGSSSVYLHFSAPSFSVLTADNGRWSPSHTSNLPSLYCLISALFQQEKLLWFQGLK